MCTLVRRLYYEETIVEQEQHHYLLSCSYNRLFVIFFPFFVNWKQAIVLV